MSIRMNDIMEVNMNIWIIWILIFERNFGYTARLAMLLQRNQTSGTDGLRMPSFGSTWMSWDSHLRSVCPLLREELMKNRMKDIKKVHGANIRGVVDAGGNLFSSNGKSLDSDLLMSQRN